MSNWQRTLDIKKYWDQANDGEITVRKLAEEIAEGLANIKPFSSEFQYLNDERDELIDTFQDAAADEELDFAAFNYYMNDLYDWADSSLDDKWNGKKVCWIKIC